MLPSFFSNDELQLFIQFPRPCTLAGSPHLIARDEGSRSSFLSSTPLRLLLPEEKATCSFLSTTALHVLYQIVSVVHGVHAPLPYQEHYILFSALRLTAYERLSNCGLSRPRQAFLIYLIDPGQRLRGGFLRHIIQPQSLFVSSFFLDYNPTSICHPSSLTTPLPHMVVIGCHPLDPDSYLCNNQQHGQPSH